MTSGNQPPIRSRSNISYYNHNVAQSGCSQLLHTIKRTSYLIVHANSLAVVEVYFVVFADAGVVVAKSVREAVDNTY